jgi:hypothetical protein
VTEILIRRFDPARDGEALRACIVDQQDFHRSLEPAWPSGQAVVADYLAHLAVQRVTRILDNDHTCAANAIPAFTVCGMA